MGVFPSFVLQVELFVTLVAVHGNGHSQCNFPLRGLNAFEGHALTVMVGGQELPGKLLGQSILPGSLTETKINENPERFIYP
jgi:hypothetical protein